MNRSACLIILFFLFGGNLACSQKFAEKVHWLNFTQLNDSLLLKPKKVFVNFYADWCMYCKEMERTTFQDTAVIKVLNEEYYAVKMNVETKESFVFGNQTFTNKRVKKLNPVHELPLLLASRKNKPFSLPAFIFFDENFQAQSRYFQFLDKVALLKLLHKE
ncbi:Thioredoxin-like [Kaistella jeonii]|uniref:Thioredoxin n=1 Tax=Kaistella jeonii TaxID=266749 RepID=A0A0C1FPD8_9FLAO|nr:thioredoxin [Kaistella jeonii]SFB87485.1 Thioredoxin-like [Kaistella jeonii]VEI95961.1 Thiol:disulfide interchange protein DsbD precursor [Kaistella jeonii]